MRTRGSRHVDGTLGGRVVREVIDDDIVTGLREMQRGRGPDASSRSGDDRDRPARLVHRQIIAYGCPSTAKRGDVVTVTSRDAQLPVPSQ